MADQLIQLVDRTGGKADVVGPFAVQSTTPPLDLATVREKLSQSQGQEYWRSLEEIADTPGFAQMLEREFPGQAPASWAALGRRDFMKLMGAALAMAGLTGCARQPQEKIIPYVAQPENMIMGKPLFFASAYPHQGFAHGVLAESNQGRPTKIEGNPDHPVSLGATDIWTQASVLSLWDPDRSQTVQKSGNVSTWEEFTGVAQAIRQQLGATRGTGFRILTGTITSPTLAAQMRALLAAYPGIEWHQWEPVAGDNVMAGARLAFGREVQPIYDFSKADVILSLDSDFLLEDPAHLLYARQFISGRRVRENIGKMNRLYAVESTPTITGAKADHRLPLRASSVEGFARALAGRLGIAGFSGNAPKTNDNVDAAKWLESVVADLRGAGGAGLVVAGLHQPPVVHAIAHAINERLGNVGKAVRFQTPVEVSAPGRQANKLASLQRLVADMTAGRVQTLLVMDSNPVYSAPADLKFLDAFKKVSTRIHHGSYFDETGEWSQWHIPLAHYLESWGDVRSVDGTVSLIQPLIAPLYQSWTANEMISVFQGAFLKSYEIVKEYWRGQPQAKSAAGGDFEKFWQTALHQGVIANTRAASSAPRVQANFAAAAGAAPVVDEKTLEIIFRPDPTIWDGRFANNGWLQELPKPLTKLTWDNTAQMSPKTAEEIGVTNQDIVTLSYGGRKVNAPVWIVPGHPDNSVTVHLGYGRTRGGQIATGIGFNANALRTSGNMWFGQGLEVAKTGETMLLACTQPHHSLHGRNHVREASFTEWKANPAFPREHEPEFHVGHEEHGEHGSAAGGGAHGNEHGAETAHGAEAAHGKADTHRADVGDSPNDGHGKENPKYKDFSEQQYISPMHTEKAGRPPVAGYVEGTYEKNKASNGTTIDGTPSNPSHPTLYPQWKYEGYAWGMAVDLNSCIGCNACVIGCQSENNIATVGKDEVLRGREMHWIRIDTYYRGGIENPESTFQPMLCQHCENAPCEPVCPVEATSHSAEGINEMTYNRCIGTRYCSNNCPYKVRRFNFLQYTEQDSPQIMLMQNPEVTVRSRGVMEKCNYCIQRVNLTRIETEKEGRAIRDGEVVTACQQACPTDAIIFGNLNDPNSRVRKLKKNGLNYGVLSELNTQPRTTYLAKVQNPNPALKTTKGELQDTPEGDWEKGV
ncbi:MAG TPA: TAT-variant-translocated molybdopterin oxidoreductase [Abditibacteriaceae bacterium]